MMIVICDDCHEPIYPTPTTVVFTRGGSLMTSHLEVGVCTCGTYFTRPQIEAVVQQFVAMGATEGPIEVHTPHGNNEFQP